MKKTKRTLIPALIVGLLAGLAVGCDDFVAEDVSEATVQPLAPADQVSTEQTEITFWWEPLSVNTAYRLQVVSPSFERAASLVVDTLVSDTQFALSLGANDYAWRVRAENGIYQSRFSPVHGFTVTGQVEEPKDDQGDASQWMKTE